MTLMHPSESRRIPIRLVDVRPVVRLDAARQVAARDPQWGPEVFAAALRPSDTVYWVSDGALSRMLRVLNPDALAARQAA